MLTEERLKEIEARVAIWKTAEDHAEDFGFYAVMDSPDDPRDAALKLAPDVPDLVAEIRWLRAKPLLVLNPGGKPEIRLISDLPEEGAYLLAKAMQELDEARTIIWGLRRGDCWCGVGIDNPMYQGKHDKICLQAQKAMNEGKRA